MDGESVSSVLLNLCLSGFTDMSRRANCVLVKVSGRSFVNRLLEYLVQRSRCGTRPVLPYVGGVWLIVIFKCQADESLFLLCMQMLELNSLRMYEEVK